MMVVASLNKSKTPCVPSPYTPTQKETFHLALPARSLFVVQGSEDGPKRQKINCSQELWHTCIGRESNPGLADIRLLQKKLQMATANFTTKPPMLDGSCPKLGFRELSILVRVVENARGRTLRWDEVGQQEWVPVVGMLAEEEVGSFSQRPGLKQAVSS
jgi:hypothetical protein